MHVHRVLRMFKRSSMFFFLFCVESVIDGFFSFQTNEIRIFAGSSSRPCEEIPIG